MKKFISIFLSLLLIFTFSTQAFASVGDDDPTEQSGIEDSFAIPPLTFTNWEVLSLQIPNSTPMLSKGVVQDGIITYQVTVRVRILNSGASYGNKSVSWTTSASSSNVRIKSSDSTTNSAGYTSATFHVRGMEKFPVSVKCAGLESKKTIDIGTRATYLSSFKITQYITAKESDYSGNKISVSGLTGKYKSAFLNDVKVQGSGVGDDGRYIKYYAGKFSYNKPTTALGTTPTVGTTIAVDPYYVPCVIRNGAAKKGHVEITGIGRRIAEDTGGAIKNFDIDVYMGVGRSSLKGIDGSYRVRFMGVNSWGNSGTGIKSSNISQDEHGIVLDEPSCHSVDGQYMAYVSDIDYSKPNSVTVSVVDNLGKANDSEPIKFELSQSALSVDDMNINSDILAVTGHINPSLQIYQRFDIPNQKLLSEYYGYGFIETEYGLFYVQAPQHFSGKSGHCRILNEDGRVLYESPDNVTIRDLRVSGDSLFFDELDLDTGNMSEKNISVFASDHTLFSYY